MNCDYTKCHMCGAPSDLSNDARTRTYKKSGRGYCSRKCSRAYQTLKTSEAVTRTNLKYASERMKKKNPMHVKETREKVSATLQAMKHKPPEQGGNGKPLPEAEARLLKMFGDLGFVGQCVVRTMLPVGNGNAGNYKIDAGNPHLKIAIEADGPSHGSLFRQAQDAKKDKVLAGLGWTVLRFKNKTILTEPEKVMETVMSTILRLKTSTPT